MTIYRWNHDDLSNTIDHAHGLIANLSYHFNRNYGLLTRLQTAIGDDLTLAADSLLTRKLKNDARALRTLARALDIAAKKLARHE